MESRRAYRLVFGALLSGGVLLALGWGAWMVGQVGRQRRTGDANMVRELKAAAETLRPLHTKMGKPKPGDWLYRHREKGQTFQQYIRCRPSLPVGRRRVLYVQPLGKFKDSQRRIVALTADFLGRFYNVPVKTSKGLPLSLVPGRARRTHPTWGDRQILSTYVLDKVLKPRLPKDAAAYLALTSSDLWPGEGWNFVFGQASLRDRVGVWSLYRFGDPDKGDDAFKLCLRRMLKTAVHETGHMFSMLHCVEYECIMCGSNSLPESDRQPLWLCPHCVAKVCWAMRCRPVDRFAKLAEFCKAHGLVKEADFYARSIRALGGAASRPSESRPVTGPAG